MASLTRKESTQKLIALARSNESVPEKPPEGTPPAPGGLMKTMGAITKVARIANRHTFTQPKNKLQTRSLQIIGKWCNKDLSSGFSRWNAAIKALKHAEEVTKVTNITRNPPGKRDVADLKFLKDWLKKLPALEGLKKADLEGIAMYVELVVYDRREVIFLQGQVGRNYYIILTGSAEVYFDQDRTTMLHHLRLFEEGHSHHHIGAMIAESASLVTVMSKGTAFGELALFSSDRIRNASVVASDEGPVKILSLSRDIYMQHIASIHKSLFELEEKIQALKGLGDIFSRWNRSRLIILSYSLKKKSFPRNSYLCKQGDIGNDVFILHKGEVQLQVTIDEKGNMGEEVVKKHNHPGAAALCPIIASPGAFLLNRPRPITATKKKTKTLQLVNLQAPQILGEGAMLRGSGTRQGSLVANTDVEVYVLSRTDFEKYVLDDSFGGAQMKNKLMNVKEFRSQLIKDQIEVAVEALRKVSGGADRHDRPSTSLGPLKHVRAAARPDTVEMFPYRSGDDAGLAGSSLWSIDAVKIDSHDERPLPSRGKASSMSSEASEVFVGHEAYKLATELMRGEISTTVSSTNRSRPTTAVVYQPATLVALDAEFKRSYRSFSEDNTLASGHTGSRDLSDREPVKKTLGPVVARPRTSSIASEISESRPVYSRSGKGSSGYSDASATLSGSFGESAGSLAKGVGWPFAVKVPEAHKDIHSRAKTLEQLAVGLSATSKLDAKVRSMTGISASSSISVSKDITIGSVKSLSRVGHEREVHRPETAHNGINTNPFTGERKTTPATFLHRPPY